MLLVMCFSCTPMYLPNTPNVPLMSEGDETQVSLTAGSNGYGLTLGYSPYYHWVVTGSGSTYSIVQDSNFSVKYKHLYGEIATGYYTRTSKFGRFEFLAGYGQGATGFPTESERFRKVFLQPSFGVSSPLFDGALTLRPAFVQHFATKNTGGIAKYNESGMFLEPFITLRGGWENIKFQFQGGYSFALGDPQFTYQKGVATIGIHVTFVKDFSKYGY